MGELRAPDRAVRPVDLHPTGASDVGALYHRTGDLQVGNVGAEQDERAGLEVDADTDDQVSKAFKTIVVTHARHGRAQAKATELDHGCLTWDAAADDDNGMQRTTSDQLVVIHTFAEYGGLLLYQKDAWPSTDHPFPRA